MSVAAMDDRESLALIERLAARHGATTERLVDQAGAMVTLANGRKFVISRVACWIAKGGQQLETQFNYMLAKCTSK